MSDVFTNRDEQGRGKGASGESKPQEPPRIRIDVPMGTPYQEIQESIFRHVYELAGTQLRAAIALGITPDTVSRILRRADRKRAAYPKVPQAWPEVNRVIGSSVHRAIESKGQTPDQATRADQVIGRSTDPVIGRSGDRVIGEESGTSDQPISGDRVNNAKSQSSVALTSSEDAEEEMSPSPFPGDEQELEADD
jgi:hypothetical protein